MAAFTFGGGSSGGGGATFGDPATGGASGLSSSYINAGNVPVTLPSRYFSTLTAPSVPVSSPAVNSPESARLNSLNIPSSAPISPTVTSSGIVLTDKRVRIGMLPNSPAIFYKDSNNPILAPLANTNGVLFPFQPKVDLSFSASYQAQKNVQSNFTFYNYENSEMKPFDLSCDFPVRTQFEGQYVIASLIFLRSLTLMFTGNDNQTGFNLAGAPPLVVSVSGMGFGGLDNIPVAITNVTTSFADTVDYVSVAIPGLVNEITKLPSVMTITVSCQPMFSRQFASSFSALSYSMGIQRLLGISTTAELAKIKSNAINNTQPTTTNATVSTLIPEVATPQFMLG